MKKKFYLLVNLTTNQTEAVFQTGGEASWAVISRRDSIYTYSYKEESLTKDELDALLEGENTETVWGLPPKTTEKACDYAAGFVENRDYREFVSESYWRDRCIDTDKSYEMMLAAAAADGIELTDLDTFNADRFFYDDYRWDEDKGLS